jgi:hypothetical protein
MRALWSEPVASFHGRFYDFADAVFFPKPGSEGVGVLVCGSGPSRPGGWGHAAPMRSVAKMGYGAICILKIV